jgi:hypothetical protein
MNAQNNFRDHLFFFFFVKYFFISCGLTTLFFVNSVSFYITYGTSIMVKKDSSKFYPKIDENQRLHL